LDVPPTNSLEFDKDNFSLVLKDSAGTAVLTYNLGNFYAYYSEDPEKLEEIIAKIRQLNFSDLDWTSYDKIAPLLMPAIRDRAVYELSWAELARDHGEAAGALVHSAVCDVLFRFFQLLMLDCLRHEYRPVNLITGQQVSTKYLSGLNRTCSTRLLNSSFQQLVTMARIKLQFINPLGAMTMMLLER
jgi:hypothetical protein